MEIFVGILAVLALLFCATIVVDRTVFNIKLKRIEKGMSGAKIQEVTGFKLHITKIDGKEYEAIAFSRLTIFKCKLLFSEGKMISKIRNWN